LKSGAVDQRDNSGEEFVQPPRILEYVAKTTVRGNLGWGVLCTIQYSTPYIPCAHTLTHKPPTAHPSSCSACYGHFAEGFARIPGRNYYASTACSAIGTSLQHVDSAVVACVTWTHSVKRRTPPSSIHSLGSGPIRKLRPESALRRHILWPENNQSPGSDLRFPFWVCPGPTCQVLHG